MYFIIFLTIALGIYSLMHLVVFWGIRPLLQSHNIANTIIGVWIVLMILGPFIVRFVESQGFEASARFFSWITYTWMGFIFLNFCLFLLIEIISAGLQITGRFLTAFPRINLLCPQTSVAIPVLCLIAACYGFYEAQNLRLETINITTDKIPHGRTIRFIQLSDLHLGLINRAKQLQPVMEKLHKLSPDLLVVTGDMVDAQINHLEGLCDLWKKITPPMGKFAVTGNHELYAGLEQSLAFLQASGFTVLRNEEIAIDNQIRLVGVDDKQIGGTPALEATLLKGKTTDLYTVLLKHRPVVEEKADTFFDLQLSGHTHRGQIFPFNLLTGMVFPRQNGLYTLTGGSKLYVSRGTGTWGPPIRLLSPPEITLFEIVGTGADRQ